MNTTTHLKVKKAVIRSLKGALHRELFKEFEGDLKL